MAVSLSVATAPGACPLLYRLYLPKEWADDAGRRATAGVPDHVCFQTKPEIALQQLRETLADGVPAAPVLIDPAYGNNSKLRAGISELGLTYAAGILPTTMLWRPGEAAAPRSRTGRGLARQGCVATRRISPSQPRHWPSSLPPMPGSRSPAARRCNTPLVSRFARWRCVRRRRQALRTGGPKSGC